MRAQEHKRAQAEKDLEPCSPDKPTTPRIKFAQSLTRSGSTKLLLSPKLKSIRSRLSLVGSIKRRRGFAAEQDDEDKAEDSPSTPNITEKTRLLSPPTFSPSPFGTIRHRRGRSSSLQLLSFVGSTFNAFNPLNLMERSDHPDFPVEGRSTAVDVGKTTTKPAFDPYTFLERSDHPNVPAEGRSTTVDGGKNIKKPVVDPFGLMERSDHPNVPAEARFTTGRRGKDTMKTMIDPFARKERSDHPEIATEGRSTVHRRGKDTMKAVIDPFNRMERATRLDIPTERRSTAGRRSNDIKKTFADPFAIMEHPDNSEFPAESRPTAVKRGQNNKKTDVDVNENEKDHDEAAGFEAYAEDLLRSKPIADITAHFDDLLRIRAPALEHHPSIFSDPFSTTSRHPLLFSRDHARQVRDREYADDDMARRIAEAYPFSLDSDPENNEPSLKPVSPVRNAAPVSSGGRSGFRKVSKIFKGKPAEDQEKALASLEPEPPVLADSLNLDRPDLVS